MRTAICAAACMLMTAGLAQAQQGYTVMTPGQPLTYVTPNGRSGYSIMAPGQPLSYATPAPNGGYNVMTPGQPVTVISPNGHGGDPDDFRRPGRR